MGRTWPVLLFGLGLRFFSFLAFFLSLGVLCLSQKQRNLPFVVVMTLPVLLPLPLLRLVRGVVHAWKNMYTFVVSHALGMRLLLLRVNNEPPLSCSARVFKNVLRPSVLSCNGSRTIFVVSSGACAAVHSALCETAFTFWCVRHFCWCHLKVEVFRPRSPPDVFRSWYDVSLCQVLWYALILPGGWGWGERSGLSEGKGAPMM